MYKKLILAQSCLWFLMGKTIHFSMMLGQLLTAYTSTALCDASCTEVVKEAPGPHVSKIYFFSSTVTHTCTHTL